MAIYENLAQQKKLFIKLNKEDGKFSIWSKENPSHLVQAIEGFYVRIDETEYSSEKYGTKQQVVIILKDKDEEYHVQLTRYTYYTLSILNRLAALDSANRILLGVFLDANKNMNVYIKHNGQTITPKFSSIELKKHNVFGPTKTEVARNKAIDGLIEACKLVKPAHDFGFSALESVVDEFVNDEHIDDAPEGDDGLPF